MAKSSSDYAVGYKKPPEATRFKSGQSGNPKGRPKGTRNLKTDLGQELSERIRIREDGEQRSISKQQAVIKALVAKAIKGDTRAATLVIQMVAKHVEVDVPEQGEIDLSDSDARILEAFVRRRSIQPETTDPTNRPPAADQPVDRSHPNNLSNSKEK